jgi:hypothetical protein
MSSSDSHDDARDESSVLSSEALTPRGGFMARPGLKPPPRHAVVVRVGDAPESEDIPVARPSIPPPPPSEPAPISSSERITARAIPKPSTPPPPVTRMDDELEQRRQRERQMTVPSAVPGELARRHALESSPPPSDAPLVSHVRDSEPPRSRPAASSRWPIVAAAAAGLVLGLASVATRLQQRHAGAPAPMVTLDAAPVAPAPTQGLQQVAASERTSEHAAAPRAEPQAVPSASASASREHALQPLRPASAGAKRSIF